MRRLPEGRSTLFKRRIGRNPYFKAFARTNFVCASGPSPASTTKIAPSTIPTTRSTYSSTNHKNKISNQIAQQPVNQLTTAQYFKIHIRKKTETKRHFQ